jgi:hypothetical protein
MNTLSVYYYQNNGRIAVQLDWSAAFSRTRVPSSALYACPLANQPAAPAAVSGSATCVAPGYKACVPETFTACALSRYPSSANQRRVVQSTRSNAALGHFQGKAGVVFLETWKTPQQSPVGVSATDWVLACVTTYECFAYVDGINRCLPGGGGGSPGGSVTGSFAVNVFPNPGDSSMLAGEWALAELMVWSRVLGEDEFDAATAYFVTRYGLLPPASPPPPLPPPSPPPPSPPPLPAAAPLDAVPGRDALYAWYSGSSWQTTAPLQWDDLSGNARHGMARGSGFASVPGEVGNGATLPVTYLAGTVASQVVFGGADWSGGASCNTSAMSAGGLYGEYYDFSEQSLNAMPLLAGRLVYMQRIDASIYGYTDRCYYCGASFAQPLWDNFAVRWNGAVVAPYSGTYTFYFNVDDGGFVYLNGELLISADGQQSWGETRGVVWLAGGVRNTLTVLYYQNGGRVAVQLDWSALYDRYHDNTNVLGRQRVSAGSLYA